MDLWQAIVLGLVQGLTEFLPISSSGHLVLMQHFLGLTGPRVFFDVMLHLGTLGAVVAAYRRSLGRLARSVVGALGSGALARPGEALRGSRELRLVALLALGSVPTAVIGLLFQEPLEALFESPRAVAGMLLVTGAWLHLPKLRRRPPEAEPGPWQALLVGTVQGIAIVPGISRSGSTIASAMTAGVAPIRAAELSFLLSIPAILGATLLKLGDLGSEAVPAWWVVAAGAAVAFAVGWASIVVLLAVLERGRLGVFSWYCFALGVAALVALAG